MSDKLDPRGEDKFGNWIWWVCLDCDIEFKSKLETLLCPRCKRTNIEPIEEKG